MTTVRQFLAHGKTAAALCVALVVAFALPFVRYIPKEELLKPSLWGLVVLTSFAGWGAAIARACWPERQVGFGLRAIWGASALAFVGGVLAAVGVLSRGVLYACLVGGCLVSMREWLRDREALGRAFRARLDAIRVAPALACAVFFVGIGVALHYLGGAADTSTNPYYNNITYYPFAKLLLEHGTLIDPFSFRRMSTLGGQAFYHALLLLRVPVLHLNLFDRAMCVVLIALLLWSHRVDGTPVPLLARLVSIVCVVALPNTSINSASYYSGVAFFMGLFQTLEYLPATLTTDAREAIRRSVPIALTGAAVCTLRQNYQVSVALFVFIGYALAVLRSRSTGPVRPLLAEPAAALVLTGLFVFPWLALLYRSNGTFLFPVMKGTFRTGVDVHSQAMTFGSHVRFFVNVWLQHEPIRTVPLFFLVGLSLREDAIRRPLASAWLSSFVGVLLLAWSFSLSDAGNLARYSYGFLTAAALLTWQTAATRASAPETERPSLDLRTGILLFALLYVLELHADGSRKMLEARVDDVDELLRRSAPMQGESPVSAPYRHIQEAVPAGARLLIMLDRPYYLDYGRNEIWNLDMPGTASLAPDIPCFRGSAPVAEYLRSKQIRYVAFVESAHSTFLYRREIWFDHIWDRDEIWRSYAPYMVDVMDNLADLARTKHHLHDEGGMVVLDLEAER